MCSGSEERQIEVKEETKKNNSPNSCLAGHTEMHRQRLTCFESEALAEVFTR